MSASITIRDASVSYFLRKKGRFDASEARGSVGAQIVVGARHLEVTALKNVSLALASGDRVGLVGINGSGKSTLLKLCAGALALKSGTIEIEGEVSPQFAIGSGIRPNLSGRRNAELKCLYMGTAQRSIPQRIEEVKELSGLGPYFELPMSTYSAGMRSRLVMSLLRLMRGDILIVDEWIGAADASMNSAAGQLQRDLISSAQILVMASHSKRVLLDWSQKVVWLDQGTIKLFGPAAEVYAEYEAWLPKAGARRKG